MMWCPLCDKLLERDEFHLATADRQAYWLWCECDCRVNAEDDEFEVPIWLKGGIPQRGNCRSMMTG
jgi:hypothetical protein